MEKFIERMCDESKELSEQISKIVERTDRLIYFVETSDIYINLNQEQQRMMKEQINVMKDTVNKLIKYRNIVDSRISYEIIKNQ